MDRPDIRDHFLGQAEGCRRLGSPFTARLCEALIDVVDGNSRFGRRLLDWRGPPRTDALALRAAGGFHAVRRREQTPELVAIYPPHDVSDAEYSQALKVTIAAYDDFLHDWLDSPPQTNEVARSAVLLGGALTIAEATGLPLDWFEVGASMGLNLGFDAYGYELGALNWGDPGASVRVRSSWRGTLPPTNALLRIEGRQGCDLQPLDPANADDRERLLAYIWADQTERLERTTAAMNTIAASPWRVERADAAEWVAARLASPGTDRTVRVIAHTIMWQYLPPSVRDAITATMYEAGRQATRTAPLAWLRMEADEQPSSAAVRLAIWPHFEDREIGRADFHGRFVEWS